LLNIDGVVQGEVQEVTLATPSRKKKFRLKKETVFEFLVEKLAQIHN
jgi:hypothetical protein